MYEDKQKIYEEIEREKMGAEFKYKVKNIKEEQCSICKNKDSCRLDICENACKNFMKKEI